jgi:hypothetical protein
MAITRLERSTFKTDLLKNIDLNRLLPWELPSVQDALAQYRVTKEKRMVSSGELIPLNERQDLLREIFVTAGLPLEKDEPIDVYNPAVVRSGGSIEFLGRVEARFTKFSTLMLHFVLENGVWTPQPTITEKLEDPSIMNLKDTTIVAGVKIELLEQFQWPVYKTIFYSCDGVKLDQLQPRIEGPNGMKDIRLVQLENAIGVYTRPQGKIGGLGQIGFTTINSLDDLMPEIIQNAPLIQVRFPKGEWGGVNEAQVLPDGRILALGHRAHKDKNKARHYYPWMFIHNPITGEIQDLGILAESTDFPPGVAKAWDLEDVLFPAGFDLDGKELTLYVGIRDTQVGKIVIKNFDF